MSQKGVLMRPLVLSIARRPTCSATKKGQSKASLVSQVCVYRGVHLLLLPRIVKKLGS